MARETILFLLTLLLVSASCEILARQTIFVNPTATCGFDCNGNQNAPFISLNQLVNRMNNDKSDTYDVYLAPGVYDGLDNMALSISGFNRGVSIRSSHGATNTFIDCDKNGRWLTVTQSVVSIEGLSIRNCSHRSFGGAILSINSTLSFAGSEFSGNHGSKGGAIYTKNSRLSLSSSLIKQNSAEQYGGGIYLLDSTFSTTGTVIECNLIDLSSSSATTLQTAGDDIFCAGRSNGTSDATSDLSNIGSSCSSSCTLSGFDDDFNTVSLCAKNSTCVKRSTVDPSLNQEEYNSLPDKLDQCGNGVCDAASESCLSCPTDCTSCSFSGAKIQLINCYADKIAQINDVTTAKECKRRSLAASPTNLARHLQNATAPVSGIVRGYFRVPETGVYEFKINAIDLGAVLRVNSKPLTNALFQQDELHSGDIIVLDSSHTHVIEVEFTSILSSSKRNIELLYRSDWTKSFALLDIFYNYNICGDGILDSGEICSKDDQNARLLGATCGDGICTERSTDSCFIDCYSILNPVCKDNINPEGHLPPGITIGDDTLGNLLYNQQVWRLPGVEHLMRGFNILTGEEVVTPLFYFQYCDENLTEVMQDVYREAFFVLPEEIFAQPSPRCSFDTTTKQYSTAYQMSNEMSRQSSLEVSANADASFLGVTLNAGFAYSQESSVKQAKEFSSKRFGSILTTEAYCITSKAQLSKTSFHPTFLLELSQVETDGDMFKLLQKYGTHYYKSAALGGKLKQVVVVDSEYQQTKTSSELSESSQYSFYVGASVPIAGIVDLDVSFSFAGSQSLDISATQQSEFESSSSRSRIITYGGAPGSFGPSSDEAPANFGEWAATVDLLPVPVQYELGRIDEIIPDTWKTKAGESLRSMWTKSYSIFQRNNTVFLDLPSVRLYTLYWDFELNDREVFGDRKFSVVIQYKNANSSTINTYKMTILSSWDYNPISLEASNLTSNRPIEFTFRAPTFDDIVGIGIGVDRPLDSDLSSLPNAFTAVTALSLLDWGSSQFLVAGVNQISRTTSQAVWDLERNKRDHLFLAYQVTNIGTGWPTVSLYYPRQPFVLRIKFVGELDTAYHEVTLEETLWPNFLFTNTTTRSLTHSVPMTKDVGNLLYVGFEMTAAVVDYWRDNISCVEYRDGCIDLAFGTYREKDTGINDAMIAQLYMDQYYNPFPNPASLPKPKFRVDSLRLGYANDPSSPFFTAWTSGSPAEVSLNVTATFPMQKAKDFLPKLTN